MKRIKKGDKVYVNAGKSKGHIGEVKQVIGERVLVQGANMIKKHVKPNPNINQQGGIISTEAPIHHSNVALYDENKGKGSRVGFKYIEKDESKTKVRYLKSNNELVDLD